ncbi:energy-coupling factor transporter ATPase [Brevibacillus laterosporus]|uniref:Energy-coupling factor transporter ATP-binding protein EcfA2 n=2 Tax=Brevibacillus TaxID=55080 RepID=A0A0F7EGV6_BRELA|nr:MULTISPECIES: energy-coupling factor transporter ATPase [Brevibacillus]AKF94199.1 cobalt transporter ATP-binding subunit [Brevibacillus laterosporus]MCR8987780.1 energy-coupling factor transporter ATPase [Brevibacillus laterosporus]MCZ0833519.1 energy-coupling factor transporter ATPase [Brevibacillus halotolerans]GIO03565.1 energy-coupling factor transporter ATP-binding protein EcfA2 [Brevibacillus halotolerans]
MQISFENVTYLYGKGTPFEKEALSHISFTIPSGSFVGIIGQTGSGKSTLIQHLNGLIKPTEGTVRVGELVVTPTTKKTRNLRRQVGLVFQYPEHQLFEETVLKDVMYGPLNYELPEQMAYQRAKESLEIVGLSFEEVKDRSPFHLSGGQMRRVAIAGVLAMQPKVLVLDEPTAGLDPAGRKAILEGIYQIHREQKLTTLLVTHSMEEAARYADYLLVLAKGSIAMEGTPADIFKEQAALQELALDVPETVAFLHRLNEKLPHNKRLPLSLYKEEDLSSYLLDLLKQGKEDVQ